MLGLMKATTVTNCDTQTVPIQYYIYYICIHTGSSDEICVHILQHSKRRSNCSLDEWLKRTNRLKRIGFVENASIRIQSNENNLRITELEN